MAAYIILIVLAAAAKSPLATARMASSSHQLSMEIFPSGLEIAQEQMRLQLGGPRVDEDGFLQPDSSANDCWRVAQTDMKNLTALTEIDWACREKMHIIEATWYISSCDGERSVADQPLLPAPGDEERSVPTHIDATSWTVTEWYLYFVAEREPVVLDNDNQIVVPAEARRCELDAQSEQRRQRSQRRKRPSHDKMTHPSEHSNDNTSSKHTKADRGEATNQACRMREDTKLSGWIPSRQLEGPRFVHRLERNAVVAPEWERLGLHRLVHAVSGSVDFVVCPKRASMQVLYPQVDLAGVKFAANPLQANYAKYPRLREADVACLRGSFAEGSTLYVPAASAFSLKARTPSIALEFTFADEKGRSVLRELARVQLLHNRDKQLGGLMRFVTEPESTSFAGALMQEGKGNDGEASLLQFSAWQRHTRLQLLAGLAIPAQPEVELAQSGRRGLRVRVRVPSRLPRQSPCHDVAAFEVQWRPAHADVALHAIITGRVCDAVAFGFVQAEPDCAEPMNEDDEMWTALQIPGLASAASYAVRARALSAERRIPGPWSRWSRLSTLGESVPSAPREAPRAEVQLVRQSCARVKWEAPADDGGHIVLSYVLETRVSAASQFAPSVSGPMHSDWRVVARQSALENKEVLICNLQPGLAHEFRVRATNELGQGWPSSPSLKRTILGHNANEITKGLRAIAASKSSLEAFEKFTENEMRAVLHARPVRRSPADLCLTISDVLEVMVMHSLDEESRPAERAVPVWASAFSPRKFDVYGDARWANPRDACSSLASSATDAILLVERGKCPLLQKAQEVRRAGALAMVVVDTSGACDQGYDHACSPGASKGLGEGFAKHDRASSWDQLQLPAVLVAGKFVQGLLT